jgi:two-component system, chemotaxis family, sensor kinase Cph1
MSSDAAVPGQVLDLTQCEREPIHIPGAIQPHGVLLALREPGLAILQVSANASALLAREPDALRGLPLRQLLEPEGLGLLEAALAGERPQESNPLPLAVGAARFDGLVHRHQGATLLELEPVRPDAHDPALQRRLQRAIARMQEASTLQALCETAAREVRALTGFERVLVYRFDEAGSGAVIAEEKAEGLDAYLGLHYPASDIPRQARELYLRNWLRLIPDRDYRPAPLVPPLRPDTGAPLDLSFAALRSVSPVHLEYLRNLGVRASMSISLISAGALWGLLSCSHHAAARHVPYEVRAACELLGRLLSQKLGEVQARAQRAQREKTREHERRLVAAMRADPEAGWLGLLAHPAELMALVGAGGVAAWSEERLWTAGSVPSPEQLEALVGWLRAGERADVLETRALPRLHPPAQAYSALGSGLLAVSIPRPETEYLLWFRPEVLQTVSWGGNPTKPAEREGDTLRLHPRRSFALWQEEVRGTSLPWTAAELEAAESLRRYAVEVDLTRQVLREQRAVQARDDLVAVVSHDLKNPLSAIQMQATLILRATAASEEGPLRRVHTSVERIHRSTERMTTLIQDLLDLAKIEAGRFIVDAKPESIESIVEESIELLHPLAEQKHIALTTSVEAPGAHVKADRDRIFQVLSNLIGNALKFTPEGGSVHLAVEQVEECVRFSVRDSGPGISAAQLPHLFNRYWQARKRAREGTGLGLFIAKGIVEAHGGTLWVESQEGVGSTFSFKLPLARGT